MACAAGLLGTGMNQDDFTLKRNSHANQLESVRLGSGDINGRGNRRRCGAPGGGPGLVGPGSERRLHEE